MLNSNRFDHGFLPHVFTLEFRVIDAVPRRRIIRADGRWAMRCFCLFLTCGSNIKSKTTETKRDKTTTMPRRKGNVTKYKKAPDAPKRFKSPFMFFSEKKHREIRDQASDNNKVRLSLACFCYECLHSRSRCLDSHISSYSC